MNATKEPPQNSKEDVALIDEDGKETAIPHSEEKVIENFLDQHKNILIGEGKIKRQIAKLDIGLDITPVLQTQRRIPYHMRKAVSEELEKLMVQDIVEPVIDQPAPWKSPIICVPEKDGDMGICVDMQEANNAIVKERHIMATLDDFKAAVNGSKYFPKVDLKQH